MTDVPIHFLSTIPRSGSTLIANLLGQNPKLHVTPTNDMIEMIVQARNNWSNCISFKSQGLNNIRPRILNMMRGMFSGFYTNELAEGKIILDKSRGWFAYIELLEEILQRKVKLIVTVRRIEDVVASFEKIYRKSALTKPPPPKEFFLDCQTIEGRASEILSKGGIVGIAISRFRDALARGLHDRLIIVPYTQLTTRPRETADSVGAALGLPAFNYDPYNVEQITQEDDTVHGMDLHKIRMKIEPEKKSAWAGILPAHLVQELDRVYGDINRIADGPVIIPGTFSSANCGITLH